MGSLRICALVLCLHLSIPPAHAEETAKVQWYEQPGKVTLQLNRNTGRWSADSNPAKKGGLDLTYFSAGYNTPKWGANFLGSHAGDLSYVYDGGNGYGDFHKSTWIDSTVSTYYVAPDMGDYGLRLGLDLNLPTGNPSFTEDELNRLNTDTVTQDLNMTTSLGKGFNIAPNFILTRVFEEKLALGLGARYEATGEYDPTRDTAGDDYNPGDTLMFMGSMQYLASDRTMITLDVSAVYSTRDKQSGSEVFKTGDQYNLTLKLIQAHTPSFRATYAVTYGWQEKNQSVGSGGMTTEDRNSNNNHYDLFVNMNYIHSNKLAVNGIVGYKTVLENGYDSADLLYDGGYRKPYAGVGASYTYADGLTVTADFRYFAIDNKADINEAANTTYRGFNFDIGIVYSFPWSWRATADS